MYTLHMCLYERFRRFLLHETRTGLMAGSRARQTLIADGYSRRTVQTTNFFTDGDERIRHRFMLGPVIVASWQQCARRLAQIFRVGIKIFRALVIHYRGAIKRLPRTGDPSWHSIVRGIFHLFSFIPPRAPSHPLNRYRAFQSVHVSREFRKLLNWNEGKDYKMIMMDAFGGLWNMK